MDRIELHESENQDGNQVNKITFKINKRKIIAVALVASAFVCFNFSFVIWILTITAKIFAIFLLIFGSIWSARLICKPRRIVTAHQAAQEITLLEHMRETEQATTNPFMEKPMWKSPIKNSEMALSWEIQRGINFESSACLLWMLSIIFLTLTLTDKSTGLSAIASLAVMGLFLNWLIKLRFFFVWRVISKKPAKTEHYGIWLFERIQYGCVVMYCLAFIAEKFRIIS